MKKKQTLGERLAPYKDLLGKTIWWNGKKGFIAAIDPDIGITTKPNRPTTKDPNEFMWCYLAQAAIRKFGEVKAKEMFDARIELLRNKSKLTCADFDRIDIETIGDAQGFGSGSCPFSI
jgi:hypothetical protein